MALGVVGLLVLVLLVVLGATAILALRHRLAFRIGLRNVARARGRTILLVLGLLVATMIVSGSFAVGDTVDQVSVHYTVLAVGYNDEVVANQSPSGAYIPFPYAVYTDVAAGTSGNPDIAGLAPEIVSAVSVLDTTSGIPQPNLNLIGVNANQSSQLGDFVADNGSVVVGPAPGEVILDDLAASEMNASAGDAVVLFGAGHLRLPSVVQAVVQDNLRGAFPTGGIGNFGSVFVDLATAQRLENLSNAINYLSVTNVGSQANRLALAPTVSATLNATLAKIPAATGLTVDQLLVDSLASANASSNDLTTLFLVLGLFAIVAGALLIVGIFVLLAEERKGEMGVLRAIGFQGRELVYSFFFEGVAYAAGSALAGTALGVGVGYGLVYAFSELYRIPGLPGNALLDSFNVTTSSLVEAYVIGFLLTLATVVVASRRASRLNIVRAIRDLPEPPPTLRQYTYLAYLGGLLVAVGALVYASTYAGTGDESYPLLGGALAIIGASLIASRFVRNRIAFSAAGVALLVWGGDVSLHLWLFGTAHGLSTYDVFTIGIILVAGALIVFAFNAASIANALVRLAGGREQRAPVAEIAFSYPARRTSRTTISLAIFALVIFVLVAIATVGASVNASLGNTLAEQSGGYTFVAYSSSPIPELPGLIANNSTLAPFFDHVVPIEYAGMYENVSGYSGNPYAENIYAAPSPTPNASNFYTTNQFTFSATQGGMSAAEVMARLASTPGVAIVDNSYSTTAVNIAGNSGMHPKVNVGSSIAVLNPLNGNHTSVTVIGIMTQSLVTGVFVSPATAAALGGMSAERFFLTLTPGASSTRAEQLAKAAFFSYGFVILDISGILASSIAPVEGIIGLLQVFVGLGLAVGIAALGIIALRSVVERRREIGMLRANGFTQRMVLGAFYLEFTFVTLVGITIGTVLGILVVWNRTQAPGAAASGTSVFAIPWATLALILVLAYGLSMLAVTQPSLRAARMPPAEAVRPTE